MKTSEGDEAITGLEVKLPSWIISILFIFVIIGIVYSIQQFNSWWNKPRRLHSVTGTGTASSSTCQESRAAAGTSTDFEAENSETTSEAAEPSTLTSMEKLAGARA